jgi:hypothetical protein
MFFLLCLKKFLLYRYVYSIVNRKYTGTLIASFVDLLKLLLPGPLINICFLHTSKFQNLLLAF